MQSVGVVVVGVGRAGGARIRDLRNAAQFKQTEHVKLIGYVSRRQLELEGSKQLTMEEALSRDDVHIVIIATENKMHYDPAKKCIAAGKHVIVEFPLGINAGEVSELQTLAKEKGVLCHEEVISLLLDSHNKMKEIVASKPPMKDVSFKFSASFNGWIENFECSGSPFTSGLSNIHELHDMFGEFEAVSASLVTDDQHFVCTGTFQTKDKKPITYSTNRTKEPAARVSVKRFVFADGSESEGVRPTFPKDGPGLFMLDFIQFLEKMEKGTEVLPSPEATLHCHQVADALYGMAQKKA